MKYKVGDRVVIKPAAADEKTKGGILPPFVRLPWRNGDSPHRCLFPFWRFPKKEEKGNRNYRTGKLKIKLPHQLVK